MAVFLSPSFARMPPPAPPARAHWLKTLHQWHWVSAAISLAAMLLFAITGFTLNHAADIEGTPQVTQLQARVPAALLAGLPADNAPLPAALAAWLDATWHISTAGREAEFSDDEVYLSLPRPGGDAWLRISLLDGDAEYERTDRGWISYLNDLHKGRNTGTAWRWFIDIFAAACLVFCATGLGILYLHAKNRPMAWPTLGLGLLLPALLALLFIH